MVQYSQESAVYVLRSDQVINYSGYALSQCMTKYSDQHGQTPGQLNSHERLTFFLILRLIGIFAGCRVYRLRLNFLFLKQNICCWYSQEPSQ